MTSKVLNLNANRAPTTVGLVRNFDNSMAIVVKKIEELFRLNIGWDGYRGVPLRMDVAYYAISVLETTLGNSFDVPSVVPGSLGTVQFEWHYINSDIELLFSKPYVLEYYIRIQGEEFEGVLSDNVAELPGLLKRAFTEANVAAAAA